MAKFVFQCAAAGCTCNAECEEDGKIPREPTSILFQEQTAPMILQDEWLSEDRAYAPSSSFGPRPAPPTKLEMPGPFASHAVQALPLSKPWPAVSVSACSTSTPSSRATTERLISGSSSNVDDDGPSTADEEQRVEAARGDVHRVVKVARVAPPAASCARPPRHAAAQARRGSPRKALCAKSLPRLLGAAELDSGPSTGLAGRVAWIFREFKGVERDALPVPRLLVACNLLTPLLEELGGLSGAVEELRAGAAEARRMVRTGLTLGEALDEDVPRHQVEALAEEAVLASPSFAFGLTRAVRALAFIADFFFSLRVGRVEDAGLRAFERQVRPQFGDGLWDRARVVVARRRFTGCLPATRDDEVVFLARLEPSVDERAKAFTAFAGILLLTEGVRRSIKARRLDDSKGRWLPADIVEEGVESEQTYFCI